jgi:hypothetical protein
MRIPQDGYWKKVGNFGVDAGICWIGDPCYILHPNEIPKELGKNWGDFCNNIDDMKTHKSFNYDMGHEGLGVCLSTGWGDGFYPVYARILNGRVMQIFIDFDETFDEDDEDIYNEDIDRDED